MTSNAKIADIDGMIVLCGVDANCVEFSNKSEFRILSILLLFIHSNTTVIGFIFFYLIFKNTGIICQRYISKTKNQLKLIYKNGNGLDEFDETFLLCNLATMFEREQNKIVLIVKPSCRELCQVCVSLH